MDELDEKLFKYIKQSLKSVYEKDPHLILNRSLEDKSNGDEYHVGERSIVFRFAHYLLNIIDSDSELKKYDLDCEYNRNGSECKVLPAFPNGVYPDVIIHKRGRNDGNLAVIEFKTYWNSDISNDEKKVKQLTDKKGKYRYNCGYIVVLSRNYKDIEIKKY